MRFHLLPLLIALCFIDSAIAEIIHIPADFESIQAAIRDDNTSDGDIILIEPGVYNDTINFLGKDITVASRYFDTGDESYIARTIVDGNDDHCVVKFQNNETENARLIGLTIRRGRAQYGGGIYLRNGSTPVLSHLIIYNNIATNNGGGIYATVNASPTLDRITVYGNQGNTFGGIRCYNGATATITNSIIYGNTPTELSEELNASYCDVEGGRDGEGNIDADPLFENAGEGDFRLTQNSQCIDAGQENATPDPDRSRADMGALSFTHIPVISITPVALNFGAIRLNSLSDRTFTIGNLGVIPLNVESITINNQESPFSIFNGGDAVELVPDEEIVVTVRFSPINVGDYGSSVRIVSNDPENGEVFVALNGSGLPPSPEIEVDPQRIAYGEVALRQEVGRGVAILNSGNADLNVESVAILEDPSFFTVDFANPVVLTPGEQLDLTIQYNPLEIGEHAATLRIVNDDQDESVIDIALSGTSELPALRHQFAENTGLDHSILILAFDIDGEPLVYGSEVAIFNEDDLCCGADYWLGNRLGMAAWGDNEMTEDVDGWQEGQAFSFKAWDLAANREVVPDVEVVEGDDHFRPNGLSVVRLTVSAAPAGFNLYIYNGWSLVSGPVIPEETNIVRLWAPIVERRHLVMMKDGGGRFYSALFGFSNMNPWDFREGYQVRGNEVDSLDIGGNYVAFDTPIPVRLGWNIVSYFPEVSLSPQVAFRNNVDQINLVKDGFGHFYLPAIGFSNMSPLRRGFAYQVRMLQAGELVWNQPQQIASQQTVVTATEHFPTPSLTGVSMSILLNADATMQNGEIAAVSPDGRLIGATRLCGTPPWGLAVWGDDITTTEKDGALAGEAIQFIYFDGVYEKPLEAIWNVPNIFAGDEFASVRLASPNSLPFSLRLEAPQPNPVNSRTTLAFSLPYTTEATLAVYDLSGRELTVLVNGKFGPGLHRTVWDATGMSSGLYIVRLTTEGKSLSTKLTLLR